MIPGFILMVYRYDPGCPCCDTGPAHDGWWFGGSPAGANADRHIYGMNFATDTTNSSTVGLLAVNRRRHASLTHQDTAVYLCGGDFGSDRFNPTPVAGEKFAISTEVGGSSTSLRLTEKTMEFAAVSERSEKGYFAGGLSEDNFGVFHGIATAWKVTFSSDTVGTQSSADLTTTRYQVVGLTEGESKGYFAGGETAATGNWLKTVDKITFASDSTSASSSAELPAERGNMNQSGVSDGDTKGYLCGGFSVQFGHPTDTVFKVTFSNDTTSNVASASLSAARYLFAGMSEGSTKGYVSGGRTLGAGGTETNATDKITFSSDSVAAVTTADLPNGRIFHTGNSAVGL